MSFVLNRSLRNKASRVSAVFMHAGLTLVKYSAMKSEMYDVLQRACGWTCWTDCGAYCCQPTFRGLNAESTIHGHKLSAAVYVI